MEVEPGERQQQDLLQARIGDVQTLIYVVVAVLLLVAGAFVLAGTVIDIFEGSDSRPIADTGAFMLDRVLLLFIIGELLYTLRLIDASGRILVEPFLLIGLIAVVRRILVITAEVEGGGPQLNDLLIEIAALSGLVLVLTISIYVLRHSRLPTDDL
jgi:uncharacterized membrane protein (DUF373 family)